MKRITPQQVRAAQEKLGIPLARHMYFGFTRSTKRRPACMCPIGALYLASKRYPFRKRPGEGDAVNWAVKRFGARYVDAFAHGFDGRFSDSSFLQKQGLKDGRSCASVLPTDSS